MVKFLMCSLVMFQFMCSLSLAQDTATNKFRYLVTTIRTPQFQTSAVKDHYAYLDRLRQQGKLELAGPFTDKSGGAYIINASNLEEAKVEAFSDPLHTTKSSTVTVYEWNAK